MTQFDPTAFLNQTFDEENSTVSTPVPEGEFTATADNPKIETWQKKDGSASGLKLSVDWIVHDDALAAELGRKEIKVRQQQMLDLTDTGALDFGKGRNVGLGRIRAALDLNKPGTAFAFNMIAGRMAKVSIKHRVTDDGQIFAEVKAVAKL